MRSCRICDLNQILVTFDQLHSKGVSESDKRDLIRRASLELTDCFVVFIWVDRRHIVAQGKSCDCVTHHILLLATNFAPLTRTGCLLSYYKSSLTCFFIDDDIIHGAYTAILTVFLK